MTSATRCLIAIPRYRHVCDLFSDEERYNYFKAAGYEAN